MYSNQSHRWVDQYSFSQNNITMQINNPCNWTAVDHQLVLRDCSNYIHLYIYYNAFIVINNSSYYNYSFNCSQHRYLVWQWKQEKNITTNQNLKWVYLDRHITKSSLCIYKHEKMQIYIYIYIYIYKYMIYII